MPCRVPFLAILTVTVLCVAGCGGSDSPPPSGGTPQQVSNGPATSEGSAPQPAALRPEPGAYKKASMRPATKAVPILLYHVIGTPRAGVPLPKLWVPPTRFAAHVKALAAAGFTAVTLDNVIDAWKGKAKLPSKPIVFSFDDGYIGQGKVAGPILKAQGWPGVLYLVLSALGTPGGLTGSRIKTMISDGWEVDAHTLTHVDVTTLDAAGLKREIAGSRKVIQHKFGVPVDSFAYPAGKYDAVAEEAVKQAGFSSATTVDAGSAKPGDDRYALPRVRINGGDDAAAVVRKVRSAS